jgi:hypothetical protein
MSNPAPKPQSMSEPMSVREALGTLIAAANPYTKASGVPGASMHFAEPDHVGDGLSAKKVKLTDIIMEEDSKYPAEWMFKGQPQKIHKALRIQYRYPKRSHNGEWYMVMDYLLIGFEGTNGG